jgi:hypothetical protein
MAQAVSRRPLIAAAWVHAQVNPVGFVMDKVALGQVFLRVLRFSSVNIIPPWASLFRKFKKIFLSFIHSPLHSSSSGDGQKARKSGRSPVRRQSHPHNQNTRKAGIQGITLEQNITSSFRNVSTLLLKDFHFHFDYA